jgi:hypothetical protein
MLTINPCPSPAEQAEDDHHEPGIEKRASYRFAVDEPAVLRLDQRRFKVRLVDASAGGFAFVVEDDRQIEVGACGELHGRAGICKVEVVYKAVLDAKARTGKRARFRIGVRRLEEIVVPEPSGCTTWSLKNWLQMSRPASGGTSSTIYTIIAILLVLAMGMLYVVSDEDPDEKAPAAAAGQVAGAWKANLNGAKPGGATIPIGSVWRWIWGRKPAIDRDSVAILSPELLKRLRQPSAIVDVISIPEAVRQLNLSDTQQAVMRHISQATQRTLADLAKRGGSPEEIAQRRAKVLEAAQQETTRLLTSPQRARWAQLAQ